MKATFELDGGEEVVVVSTDRNVALFHRVGIVPVVDEHGNRTEGRSVREEHGLLFNKTVARAVASAIMGAAAEL